MEPEPAATVTADASPPARLAAGSQVEPAAAMVEFQDVSKIYPNGVQALRGVTLRIEPDEFVFIVGPTGTGKSTLIKLIYREALPSAGRVFVAGNDVTQLPSRQIPYLRRRVGVVFQDFKLLPRKTAWENVAFALDVTGAPRATVDDRVAEVLDVVGLTARSGAVPGELSAGEQQRVSIARALVHRPALFLADEPTGNLDPDTSSEIIRLLSRINVRGTTVMVATHDKAIVDMLRKRVIALDEGQVVRDQARGLYAGSS